jgi:hypothetical protein
MMSPEKFINTYIDDALSIAALCSDLGYSREDAKLFAYIHVKSSSHPAGIGYFNDEGENEVLALEIMLGFKEFPSLIQDKSGAGVPTPALQELGASICDRIKDLDRAATEGCGMESYLRSELLRRLRFHKDPEYRKEKLDIYTNTILPRMKEYTKKKVFEVFERERNEAGKIVLNFRDSLN